ARVSPPKTAKERRAQGYQNPCHNSKRRELVVGRTSRDLSDWNNPDYIVRLVGQVFPDMSLSNAPRETSSAAATPRLSLFLLTAESLELTAFFTRPILPHCIPHPIRYHKNTLNIRMYRFRTGGS